MKEQITLDRKQAEELALILEELSDQTDIQSESNELDEWARLLRDKVAGRIE